MTHNLRMIRHWSLITILVVMCSVLPIGTAIPISKAATPSGSATLTINGGGGTAANGSDGIKLNFNVTTYGGEQITFRGKNHLYLAGEFGAHLNIGGATSASGITLSTENLSRASKDISGGADSDTFTIGNLTGSANITGATTTGDATAVMTYTKVFNTRTYTLVRSISYIYPNRYYSDSLKVIIPAGNTSVVTLYKGGDTAPGETIGTNDCDLSGMGMIDTVPMRDVTSIDTTCQAIVGMRENMLTSGMVTFNGAVSEHYTIPIAAVISGSTLDYYAQQTSFKTDNTHDSGLMVAYTIGSTAGTYIKDNITYVSTQGVNLDAIWSNPTYNSIGHLYLPLSNSMLTNQSGLGYTFTLPTNLVYGTINNTCGGTATVVGNVLTVTGAAVNALSKCVIDFDVGATANATYTLTSASVGSVTGVINAVGKSSVAFSGISPTFTITPTPTITNTPTNTATNTSTSTNTPTNTSTPTLTPTATNTSTPTDTATNTATPTNTFTRTPTNTPTDTNTPTNTNTPTYTNTPTNTPTNTYTATPTNTPTNTSTRTPTNTPTDTYTPTNTNTPTNTPTNTYTPTPTNTPTNTLTPTNTNTSTPTNTPTITNTHTRTPRPGMLRKVAIGNAFILGLLRNGTLVSWGLNNSGQSVIPDNLNYMLFKDVAAGIGQSYALSADGDLYTWGENLYGEGDPPNEALHNVKAIAAGSRFAFAITQDDTVEAWGRDEVGQTDVPPDLFDVIAIDGGDRHAVALRRDGTVRAWGESTYGQTRVPPGLRDVIAVSAGENHTLALLDNGTVVGWGSNSKGQIKIPLQAVNVVQIAAGRNCSLAVKADGTMVVWGDKTYTAFPATITNGIIMVDSANQNSVIGMNDGRVFVAGLDYAGIKVSRTATPRPAVSFTPSLTLTASQTLTPSSTKTATRTLTPSRTKSPTRTR